MRLKLITALVLVPAMASASVFNPISLVGIPFEFMLFAGILLGVALFHHQTTKIALVGLGLLLSYKLLMTDFDLMDHAYHEGLTLINLFGLLIGFAILAAVFEHSNIPKLLPNYLADDWKGAATLILLVAVLSSFLDNIAAAIIGGAIAHSIFKGKVHVGYVAAIVGASNAGGAGSVVGDTTTTMMWIDGVPALKVLSAYIASVPAVLILAYAGAKVQQRHQPIVKSENIGVELKYRNLLISLLILVGAIATNVLLDMPALGVWIAIAIGALLIKLDFRGLPDALKGAVFLLSLVFCASLMPVEALPEASWKSALALGFVSAVFDNIPLTKLALEQGGYDWGMLAYAVGFGGSMIWFGSSAGVAISSMFPQARSAVRWIKDGWFVILAYVVGFFTLYLTLGWNP